MPGRQYTQSVAADRGMVPSEPCRPRRGWPRTTRAGKASSLEARRTSGHRAYRCSLGSRHPAARIPNGDRNTELPMRVGHVLLTLESSEVPFKDPRNCSHLTRIEHDDASTDLILNLCKRVFISGGAARIDSGRLRRKLLQTLRSGGHAINSLDQSACGEASTVRRPAHRGQGTRRCRPSRVAARPSLAVPDLERAEAPALVVVTARQRIPHSVRGRRRPPARSPPW